jgi:hypothetical protein
MGFLSSMLPTLIGAGVTAATGGAAAPWVAAGLGAIQAKRTGSLEKGIMAGLGAYGGSQLASGFLEAGAAEAANAAVPVSQASMNPDIAATMANESGGALSAQQLQNQATQDYAKNFMAAKDSAMNGGFQQNLGTMGKGISAAYNNPTAFMNNMGGGMGLAKTAGMAAAPMLGEAMTPKPPPVNTGDQSMPQRLRYEAGTATPLPAPDVPDYGNLGQDFGRQQSYFPNARYVNMTPEEAKQLRGYAGGGPVEAMSNANAIGANTGYPMADINKATYATPYQTPISQNVVQGAADTGVNSMTGEMNEFARGGIADAHYNLGGYSDGGRLLRGPGDGVSDSIPATIGNKQPARLADGEFVVPARIVSELGNGSTEAGARKLYAMLDRVQQARGKTVGKGKVAKNTRADKLLPA